MYKKQINNLIYFLSKYNNLGIIHDRIKQISNDEYNCINEQEKDIKRFYNCANFVYSNVNQTFNEELLNQAYFLLTNNLIQQNIVKDIISVYYKNIDNSPHTVAAIVHLTIVKNLEFKSHEFAFIISNYIMLKKERWFLIPFEFCFNDYNTAIESNEISALIRLFYDIEIINKEKKPCLYSYDEVIKKIKNEHNYIVEKFNINKLYLFGSFAKKTHTEKSDLDFIVIFNEQLINDEKSKNLKKLKKHLEECFECDVDLLDFSYAIDVFDKSQMEHLITLI